jgi:hypothetical protein
MNEMVHIESARQMLDYAALPSHDGTNSHHHCPEGVHVLPSTDTRIHQLNELPQREPTATPNTSEYAINDYCDDSRDEANILQAKRPQDLPNNKQPQMLIQEKTKVKRQQSTKQILISWWPEVIWCIFTAGLLIALAALLKAYDKQPAPQWYVSLNTVVAAIATICRASMVIPISEGLSQLKWNAFARSQRPLIDLQTFDQASRGPFGSLMLLLKTRGR